MDAEGGQSADSQGFGNDVQVVGFKGSMRENLVEVRPEGCIQLTMVSDTV